MKLSILRKPSISTVHFAEVKEQDVESGLGVENPQEKRLSEALLPVSRFKSRRFRPTSDPVGILRKKGGRR